MIAELFGSGLVLALMGAGGTLTIRHGSLAIAGSAGAVLMALGYLL